MSYLYVKWNSLGVVRSPTVPSFEHGLSSLATPGTEACDAAGGAFRPQRERVASAGVSGESRPEVILANATASAVCITSDLPVRSKLQGVRRRVSSA